MKCPTCPDAVLVMSERQGVEIDYCPTCRGVWLDRGELDKILERASAELVTASAPAPAPAPVAAPVPPPPVQQYDSAPRYDDRRDDHRRDDQRKDDRRYDQPYPKKKKKKTSFLEDLFEF